MTYLRTTLTVVAALLIGVLVPALATILRGMSNSKATGMAALVGSLVESFFTPWFWILFISFFVLFRYCSRLNSTPLRIFFFWTPVTAISTLGLTIAALFTYLWVRFGRG